MLLVNVGQGKSLHCPQLCSPRPMEHKRIAHSAQNLCADAVSAWQPKQIRSSVVKVFLRGGKLFDQLLPELCIPCFRINKKRTIAAVETAAG